MKAGQVVKDTRNALIDHPGQRIRIVWTDKGKISDIIEFDHEQLIKSGCGISATLRKFIEGGCKRADKASFEYIPRIDD
jgi:hypothetical protein